MNQILIKGFTAPRTAELRFDVPSFLFDAVFLAALAFLTALMLWVAPAAIPLIAKVAIASALTLILVGLLLAVVTRAGSMAVADRHGASPVVDFRYYALVCGAAIILAATLQAMAAA